MKTLLKFRLPARTVVKKSKYSSSSSSSSSTSCDSSPLIHSNTPSYWKQQEPGFVTLSCTDRAVGDYTLSYTDGSKLISNTTFCPQYPRMTNSCNGLVGVYNHDIFWITNPHLAQTKSIIRENDSRRKQTMPLAAMGFDPSTGQYKVVEIYPREYEGFKPRSIGCKVMTMTGRDSSWRSIKNRPRTGLVLMEDHLPVAADGVVYWTLEHKYSISKFKRPAVALSFDLTKEKFSVVLHPEGYSTSGTSRLVALGGRLCLADTRSGQMTIWALEDHKNSQWVKQREIDLSKLDESKHLPSYKLTPLAIDDERIILYYGQKGRREYYDIPTMSFLEHETINNVDLEFVAPYAPSDAGPPW